MVKSANISVLLISNDLHLNHSPQRSEYGSTRLSDSLRMICSSALIRTEKALRELRFEPSIIILGTINEFPSASHENQRLLFHSKAWPRAFVAPAFGASVGSDCRAEGYDCGQGAGHQCFPGPLIRQAEEFAEEVIKVSESLGVV